MTEDTVEMSVDWEAIAEFVEDGNTEISYEETPCYF